MTEKVAIITPCFNRAHTLRETAESVLGQTHQNWEWLLVDDGSSDGSWELIQSLCSRDERIKGIQRKDHPKGANSCRNIGADRASADWLIFLDSDDLLGEHCLRQRLSFIQEKTMDSVYYFPTVIFKDSPDEGRLWDDSDHPMPWLESVLLGVPPCQSTGPFWHRSQWNQYGGWTPNLHVWQDLDLHARAHWKGAKFISAEGCTPDVFHRVSDDSISRVGFHSKEKLESRLLVIEECWNRMQQRGASESERKAMVAMTMSAVKNGANLGLFSEMKAMLAKPQFMLDRAESARAQGILRSRRWKLDRIPQVRRQIQRQWNETLPSSGRKLGRHRWTPQSS